MVECCLGPQVRVLGWLRRPAGELGDGCAQHLLHAAGAASLSSDRLPIVSAVPRVSSKSRCSPRRASPLLGV